MGQSRGARQARGLGVCGRLRFTERSSSSPASAEQRTLRIGEDDQSKIQRQSLWSMTFQENRPERPRYSSSASARLPDSSSVTPSLAGEHVFPAEPGLGYEIIGSSPYRLLRHGRRPLGRRTCACGNPPYPHVPGNLLWSATVSA